MSGGNKRSYTLSNKPAIKDILLASGIKGLSVHSSSSVTGF